VAADAGAENPVGGTLPAALDARFRLPLMNFFLRRIKDRAEAEDLTQEVFVRLIGTVEPDRIKCAEAFVFRVAANLLIDRSRVQNRRSQRSYGPMAGERISRLDRDLVEDREPERVLLGRESLTEVMHSLDALGERTRDIFVLFRLQNVKQRDIAALYGIGRSTVEKHVMKAALHIAACHGGE
jgi:RNA polymerase sigma factor (sigma-70 family)